MKYRQVYDTMVKLAGKWDKGIGAKVTPELWAKLRKMFPSLPAHPKKSVVGVKNIVDPFKLGDVGFSNLPGSARPKFGAGWYKPLADKGSFLYKATPTGKMHTVNLADIPVYNNVRKLKPSHGSRALYDMLSQPGKTPWWKRLLRMDDTVDVDAAKAQQIMSGDQDWWRHRVRWRKSVPLTHASGRSAEEIIETGGKIPHLTVVNKPTRFHGRLYDPKVDGSFSLATAGPNDKSFVMLHNGWSNESDWAKYWHSRAAKDPNGFVNYKYGILPQPHGVVIQDKFKRRLRPASAPGFNAVDMEILSGSRQLTPGAMHHEFTHGLQNPSALNGATRSAAAQNMGIDMYAYNPVEAMQSGLAYKTSIRAAQKLPQAELERIFGDQAARVRSLSPFATGSRKVYRDLEYLRRHPEVTMKLGEEVERQVSRYAQFKQLSWDIKRRQGLLQQINGRLWNDLDAARTFVGSHGSIDGTPISAEQAEALKSLFTRRRQNIVDMVQQQKAQANTIDSLYRRFMEMHKSANTY